MQFFSQADQALSSQAVSKNITWQAFPKRVRVPPCHLPSIAATVSGCSRKKSPTHWLILGWQLQVKDSTGSALESWQKADSTRDVQVRHAIRLTVHASLSQVRWAD